MTTARVNDEPALIAAAAGGDEQAFRTLTQPYERELHLHCYRMMGSLHDAEEQLQETLLRAWRKLDGFEQRSSIRTWLYRIATNACLNAIAKRSRTPAPTPPAIDYPPPTGLPPSPVAEVSVLEPYPETLLERAAQDALDPEAAYVRRESVELAFLAAVQLLPPRQRAALILREVLDWSAAEVADLLETTVPAVNSALQRARAAVEDRFPDSTRVVVRSPEPEEMELVRRFADAWRRADINEVVSLLRKDAILAMPPAPIWAQGREAIAEFFGTVPADGRFETIELVETRVNGDPAFGCYIREPGAETAQPYGIMVLHVRGGEIAAITGFAELRSFEPYGLPAQR